jgi:hypothetical protein
VKYKRNLFIFFFLVVILISCPIEYDIKKDDVKPANVNFINYTSYQVDVYKNFNPVHFDPTSLVCTVNSGGTKMIEQYSSYDQVVGDTFYPRYKIQLADIFSPGVTTNIYIDAQRLLTNLTFIIESGKSYSKSIPQPNKGELSFFHGYIEIQNQGTSQIQIIRGVSPLSRLDNDSIYIGPGHIGFFEIEFPSYSSNITMDQLKAFGNNFYDFPTFTAERGKLYRFVFKNDNTVVWNNEKNNEPIKNLDPLGD